MIRKIYQITLLILVMGVSFYSHATEETYSVRRAATDIIIGSSFEVRDGRFSEIELDHFKDKETRFLVKFGIDERDSYGFFSGEATIDAEIKIEGLGPTGEVLSTKTEHLVIVYDPALPYNVDLDAVLDGGHNRYRVTIEDIILTDVASIPDYIFIEGELQIDRFYELDQETVPDIATVFTAYNNLNIEIKQPGIEKGDATDIFIGGEDLRAQEVEIFWPYIEGAEEYELEWTWVDNYNENDFGDFLEPGEIDFNERDFELNNTRIITSAQTYRIPLIYSEGYLIYRVRAVGRWTDNDLLDTDKLLFGPWSSDSGPSPNTVANWRHYIQISSDHEAIKNWQYQAVYAEEGKKKEIVSYFDGSLRNRQTVTRINSNNEAIVGENIYDNQGRSAVQILPTPVQNAALRYYIDLNKRADEGNPVYTHNDFDWDSGDAEDCIAGAAPMYTEDGASKYYSTNNTVTNDWQDYVPDAEGFPFVQVEYTPDNTGRIRRQSGVGSDYTIDGEHATQYFYLQPLQTELNRLFGFKVGNAQHYKKNLVVDANGQVSISYIDPQGRVVATALAGDNSGLSESETLTNLISLASHGDGNAIPDDGDGDGDPDDGDGDENHITVTADLLNKLAVDAYDTELDNNHKRISGKQGASYDGLLYNTQYASVDEQVHQFEYSVITDVFEDPCAPGVSYPFAYNLSLDIKDDCGTSLLSYDHDDDSETDALEAVELLVEGTEGVDYTASSGTTLTLAGGSLTAELKTGAFSLAKYIEVDNETLERHLKHYMDNLPTECLPDFFNDNVDCNDAYPDPAIIDGEYVFGDFDLTTCNIALQTMITDIMPGGQYGGTDPDDQASIFHLNNALQQGQVFDCDAVEDGLCLTWQFPKFMDDFSEEHYYDENGDLSLIEVELVEEDPDVYSPELTTDRDGFNTITIDGIIYAEPKYLANSEDFIANWEGTWAKSLVIYHPEYAYYSQHYEDLCETTSDDDYSGTSIQFVELGPWTPISSETYNLVLPLITTYAQASTDDNPFSTILVPTTSDPLIVDPLRLLDPYFNLKYPKITALGADYTEDIHVYKRELMDEIIDHYKNNNLGFNLYPNDDFDLWQMAVKIVYCGSDFTGDCVLDADPLAADPGEELYPGGSIFDGLSIEQKNRVWNTYKQMYLGEKRKIDQVLLDCWAIRQGFFNGYIGVSEPEAINMSGFLYYDDAHLSYTDEDEDETIDLCLMALYLDAITEGVEEGYDVDDTPFPWFEYEEVGLFSEKIKRFEPVYGLMDAGLPEDVLLADLVGEADAGIYEATGQCAQLRDAEAFLRAMAENEFLFHGSSVNADVFPWLTGDLYGEFGMGGGTGSYDVLIETIISASDLTIQVKNAATGNFFLPDGITPMLPIVLEEPAALDLDFDFDWDWTEVTRLRMMYYEPESADLGVFDFQILAELEEVSVGGELVYREVVLNGSTEIEIGDCFPDEADLEEPLCERDENFANNIRAVFETLYDIDADGDFDLYTDIPVTSVLGGWFATSEMATQLGDDPASPVSKITSTAYAFTIELADLNREIEVDFSSFPDDIALVNGASFNIETGVVTLYYMDVDGNDEILTATVNDIYTDPEGLLPDAPFLNLDCMCGEEREMASSFLNLLNELLIFTGDWAEYDEYPYYTSEATEFLEGLVGEEVGISHLTLGTDGLHITMAGMNSELQCTFDFFFEDLQTDELTSIYGFELHVIEDPTYSVELIAYGVLVDGLGAETIVAFESDVTTSFESSSGGCFRKIGCGCTHPATLAPQSCTDQLKAYNEVVTILNVGLAGDFDLPEEEDELYDVSFPIILKEGIIYDGSAPLMMTAEQFCDTRLAYGVEAYIEYLDKIEVNSTEDDNYISLATFGITALNYYFIDEWYWDGTEWELGTDLDIHKIDPIQMYDKYLEDVDLDLEPYLSWNDYVDGVYLMERPICPPNPLPYYPTYEFDPPCEEWTANTDTVNAKNQMEIYLERLAENFRERYVEEAISSLIETFEATYYDKEYHYTLYYYDQAGNLIQTVPPKGVDRLEEDVIDNDLINTERYEPAPDELGSTLPTHTFQTKYKYNSLNQLVWQSTPDGGESYFGYDELGRLVVSQNAKQAAQTQEQFSYTRYDGLGRIVEVGEMTVDADYGFNGNGQFVDPFNTSVDVSHETFPGNLLGDLEKLEEVTQTQYDQLIGIDPSKFKDYSADNTRNRITGVYYYETYFDGAVYLDQANYDNATFYDYDVHGNVKELIQDNNDDHLELLAQDEKKIEYEYDLVSGNVKHVTYQKDKLDQFIHEYEYDADNRITNVRTSHDNVLWEQDAKYFYYDHGPLARTEIGDKKVQSNDFAYTIQGWLKGVNSENLDATKDQGKDGKFVTGEMNKMNGRDVFGYSLHYFDDDYNARQGNDFLALSSYAGPHEHDKDLYNGNIKEMYTASTNTAEEYIGTSHTWYNYDQLNRIIDMDQEHLKSATISNRYKSHYAYDQNGNLGTLKRWAWNDDDDQRDLMDHLIYSYTVGNNQLRHVKDEADIEPYDFVVDLKSQIDDNYVYDEIGQLIEDAEEDIEKIEWKVTGKVHKIIWDDDSPKDNLEFIYDAMGNRIQKNMTFDNGDVEKTYYIRDAQGNVMSIYSLSESEDMNGNPLYGLKVTERSIYGSSRVGTENPEGLLVAQTGISLLQEFPYERNIGDKRYELSNHLGNVLNVVTDRKLQMETTEGSGILAYYSSDVVSQLDYYPFGMLMPNTNIDPSTGDVLAITDNDYRYSFQGQEKDDEIKGEGNSINYKYRMHDPRVGRFFAVDPLAPKYPHNGPYNFSENMVIHAVELEGLEAVIIAEDGSTGGLRDFGHTFIFVNETVYTYGRYAGTTNIPGTIGPGVLIKMTGKEAEDYIKKNVNEYNAHVYEVADVNADAVQAFFEEKFNSSSEIPDEGKYAGKTNARVIDEYNIFQNNCTTISCESLDAGGIQPMKGDGDVESITDTGMPSELIDYLDQMVKNGPNSVTDISYKYVSKHNIATAYSGSKAPQSGWTSQEGSVNISVNGVNGTVNKYTYEDGKSQYTWETQDKNNNIHYTPITEEMYNAGVKGSSGTDTATP